MGLISDIRQDLDASALQLITEYRDRLFAEAVRLCADVSAAEDLVSRTLDKAIRNLESHRKESSVFGWMKSIMQNLHRNDNRSPVVRGTTPVDPSVIEECSEADWTTDKEILRRSDSQALREALGRLDPEFKKAMVLHYLAEMPVKQIAAVMNAPVGTVLWRLSIARKILARDLGEKLGKKPLAVLFAALLGIGSLFGAWQAGLLAPLLQQSGEAERGEAESFPLQEETESFPLQEEAVSTQTQPQPETGLAQEKTVSTQTESKEGQTMNLKTVKTLAASAVVAASAAVAKGGTPDDYIQDGLIAMWDGYENDGAGGHATELAEWKDTTGEYSFVFGADSGITVNGAALVFTGASGCRATLNTAGTEATFDKAKDGMLEIVFKPAADRAATCLLLRSSSTSGIAIGHYYSRTSWIISAKGGSPKPSFDCPEETVTLAIPYSNGVASAPYLNGQVLPTSGSDSWGGSPTSTALGSNYYAGDYFKGEISAIRLYSKKLTPGQLAENRAIDESRFVEGNFDVVPNVRVQGYPEEYATAAGEPQYGLVECAVGETFSMSVSESFVAADGHTIECLGWKLYDRATGELIGESTEQNRLICEFTYEKKVNLVWQWKVVNLLTVRNFDEDLATVYVDDVPTTNGQVVAVGSTVKIELKDFRDDYYFRFAPETQIDRKLALKNWEGVPTGYEGANPATFDVEGDLTITPNIDVKGYCWTIDGATLQNETFRWNYTKNDTTRTIGLAAFKEHVNEVTENTLTLDLVQRVLFSDKLYTITGFNGSSTLKDSHICEIALPRRFTSFCWTMSADMSPNAAITNYFYASDVAAPTYGGYSHYYPSVSLKGPATNFIARHAVSFGVYDFMGKAGMTGPLVLDSVRSIGDCSFYGCSGLTELDCTSPYLTTVAADAFSGCSQMGKVTIGSSVLTSVASSAFPANITNFVFLGAPPSQAVAGNIVGKMPAGVAKTTRFTFDGSRGDWWTLATKPTEEELDAGLPADCIGILEDKSGNRKAWIVSDKPLEGMLIETDMTKVENEGYSVRTGLELGDELELIAPEGMSQCELQHMVRGEWKTYDTQVSERVTYKHGGELTRVVWRVDGVTLNLSATGYKGTLRVEVKSGELVASSNVYSRGAEVWVTAVGAAERPRSTISRWTGVPAGQETNETVKLVLNADMNVNALFRPVEWVYDPATQKITDGEYTSSARASALIGEDGMSFGAFSGGQNYELWLDLSLPIYNPEDPTKDYWIAGVTSGRNGSSCSWKRVRFGPRIVSMPGAMFFESANLEEMEHFGQIQVEALADYFFYNYGNGGPVKNRTYEAEDAYPSSLKRFGYGAFSEGPKLKGKITVGLNNLEYISQLIGRAAAVTNWIFTAEDLPAIGWETASFAPTTVTFASTNLTLGANGVNVFHYGDLRDLIFLAHAPSAAVMNSLTTTYLKNTNTVIHCSKYAPGWKELRMKGYASCPEWEARPEDCWGIYQTDNGKKRFYLVQKNSKYDVRTGFSVLVK